MRYERIFSFLFLALFVSQLEANPRCRSRILDLQNQKSNPTRVKILLAATGISLGLLYWTMSSSSPTTNSSKAIQSSSYQGNSDSNSYSSSQSGISQSQRGGIYGASSSNAVMVYPEDIPTQRTNRFEKNRQRVQLLIEREEPNWDKIFDNPAVTKGGEEEFSHENQNNLSIELSNWEYGLSLEDRAATLPHLMEVLAKLDNQTNVDPNNNELASPTSWDPQRSHIDFVGEVTDAIADLSAVLPDPNELGPSARSRFDQLEESMRPILAAHESLLHNGEYESAAAFRDILSMMWQQQLRETGTISLPSNFERGMKTETYTDGSSRSYRTIQYRDSRYSRTARILDELSFPESDHPALASWDDDTPDRWRKSKRHWGP